MEQKIKLFTDKKTVYRLVRNISYALGTGRTCDVYMKDGKCYHCAMGLAEILLLYTCFGFHSIHKSTMINVFDVFEKIAFDNLTVTMNGGKILAISYMKRRYFNRLKILNLMDLERIILKTVKK